MSVNDEIRAEMGRCRDVLKSMYLQGLDPAMCDTSLPYYDVNLPCGVPTECDEYFPEYIMVPGEMLPSGRSYSVNAMGDSMIGAGIESGDRLIVEKDVMPQDGDIVVVCIDGEHTIKAFFTDMKGRHWLLPKNPKYNPILLDGTRTVYICGCVRCVLKKNPKVSYRECEQILQDAGVDDDAAVENGSKKDFRLKPKQLVKAIEACEMYMWGNSSYAVLYCLCRDEFDMEDNQTAFEQMVESLPFTKKRTYRCSKGTLANAFSNNFVYKMAASRWGEKNAPPRVLKLLSELRKQLNQV